MIAAILPYWGVLRVRFQLLQYRASAAVELGSQVFFGIVVVAVFEAFFRAS